MTNIVVTSDWHGDWSTDGYSRHADFDDAVDEVLEAADGCGLFMFLGDLANPYSKDVHRTVRKSVQVAAALARAEVVSVWITGNHDVVEDAAGSHTLMGVSGVSSGLVFVVDEPTVLNLGYLGVALVLMPYTSTARSYDPAEFIESAASKLEGVDRPVIVAGHLNLEGITPGSETTDMARGRDVFYPVEACKRYLPNALLLNGHYHQQQVFDGVHIPGSLLRLAHGEEYNRTGYMRVKV